MPKLFATAIIFLFCLKVIAQPNSELDNYLKSNNYIIKVNEDNTTSFADGRMATMLGERMKGKLLFVYGEGFSHNLYTNGYLECMLADYFTGHGLKYLFGEQARSWVVTDDLYYNTPNARASVFFPSFKPETHNMYLAFKKVYQKGRFEFKGVDFERRASLRAALDSITARLAPVQRQKLHKLAPYTHDTSYMQLSPGKFVKFYETQRDNFYRDSSLLKPLLGDMYASFSYLMSDPEPSQYTDNRNKNMANHVRMEMTAAGHGNIYMLSCGAMHARRKGDLLQKSTVGYLEATDELKDKILTASLYCENCHPEPTQYGVGDNDWLKFMKADILQSFQKVAGTNQVVLFDLTNLPEKYQHMRRDYVDLLVYVKNGK